MYADTHIHIYIYDKQSEITAFKRKKRKTYRVPRENTDIYRIRL